MIRLIHARQFILALLLLELAIANAAAAEIAAHRQRMLYVASPGVRDNLDWGGHGVLVFDINDGHRFVKRIPLSGYGIDKAGKILSVRGICANANTGRLFVSTVQQLLSIDLLT